MMRTALAGYVCEPAGSARHTAPAANAAIEIYLPIRPRPASARSSAPSVRPAPTRSSTASAPIAAANSWPARGGRPTRWPTTRPRPSACSSRSAAPRPSCGLPAVRPANHPAGRSRPGRSGTRAVRRPSPRPHRSSRGCSRRTDPGQDHRVIHRTARRQQARDVAAQHAVNGSIAQRQQVQFRIPHRLAPGWIDLQRVKDHVRPQRQHHHRHEARQYRPCASQLRPCPPPLPSSRPPVRGSLTRFHTVAAMQPVHHSQKRLGVDTPRNAATETS